MRLRTLLIALICGVFASQLLAQPRLIKRQEEQKEYPELQVTEKIQEANIQTANNRFATLWWLVDMARADRKVAAKELKDPLNFENTYRLLKFTPRNTYVRYVTDIQELDPDPKTKKIKGSFVLSGFGAAKLDSDAQPPDPENPKRPLGLLAQQKKKVDEATKNGVKAVDIQFNQGRIGIELTQFEFIYETDEESRATVGSRRKSVALFYKKGGDGKMTLDLVVTRIVQDHLRNGVKFIQLVLDPTPLTPEMDDVIIYDRYNQKPTDITVLGMMSNTPNNPHRLHFKQKFYVKLTDHFYRLYRMLAGYAKRDGNDYNQKVLEKLEKTLEY